MEDQKPPHRGYMFALVAASYQLVSRGWPPFAGGRSDAELTAAVISELRNRKRPLGSRRAQS